MTDRINTMLLCVVVVLSLLDVYFRWDENQKIKELEEKAEYADVFITAHGWNIAQLRHEFDAQKRRP